MTQGHGTWALVGVLATAAGVRVVLLLTPALALDGDEAVSGLAARRILEGHHRAFFPGQDYMGSLEQYLQAGVLWLLPDTAFTLRLPQVVLAVVACFFVHRVALRCGLSPGRALVAAAVFAVGPYVLVYWGVKSRGAYGVAMVLALCGLLIALSVEPGRRRLPLLALFGLVCGLAFWSNQQTAYVLVPAAWWLLATVRPYALRAAVVAGAGFAVGAAPALWHTATTGAGILEGSEGPSSVAERASYFLADTLPDVLGVRDDGEPLVPWLPPSLLVIAALLVFGAALDRHRRGLSSIVSLRTADRCGVDLLLLVLLVVPLLFVQSGKVLEPFSVRLVFVPLALLPILAAAVPVPRWASRLASPTELAVLLVAVTGLHTWIGAQYLIADFDDGHRTVSRQRVDPDDLDDVLAALHDVGAHTAFADYWLAHPLNWEADGSILVESAATRRFPHISAAFHADPSPALVVDRIQGAEVAAALGARGSSYRTVAVRGWVIFTDVDPGVHPAVGFSIVEDIRTAP